MGKSTDHSATTQEEFFKLEQVLNQTADDTSNCLKLLKKHLSEYDSRNGNHFVNTASSYMRSDMRTAKDTSMDLKHVAHQINKNHKPSKTEISSARNMMNATAKAMETLKITAHNYDKENGQRAGVKGKIDAAVGGHQKKDEKHGMFGKDDKHKENEERGGLFAKDKEKESEGGLFGKSKDDEKGGLFGKDNKEKDEGLVEKDNKEKDEGLFEKDNKEKDEGLFGKDNKEKDKHCGGFLGGDDNNGGGIMGSTETVEVLVTKTLRDNFSLSALDQQITASEKSLSPSIVERAKEAMHDVKDKLKGDKSNPEGHHTKHEGHHFKHTVTP